MKDFQKEFGKEMKCILEKVNKMDKTSKGRLDSISAILGNLALGFSNNNAEALGYIRISEQLITNMTIWRNGNPCEEKK